MTTTTISQLAVQLDESLPDDGPTGLCAQADGEWNCYEIWEFVAKHFGV